MCTNLVVARYVYARQIGDRRTFQTVSRLVYTEGEMKVCKKCVSGLFMAVGGFECISGGLYMS